MRTTAKLRMTVIGAALGFVLAMGAGFAQAGPSCQLGTQGAQAAQCGLMSAMPRFRLAEGSSRACTESCIAQCRSAERSCGGKADCRAQFQICARRCVVSCGSR